MTERYDQDMILGYVEGDLDDVQRVAFEATLAQDHELRNLVSQMKLDRESLRRLGGVPAPVGLIDQVMQVKERAELLGDPEAPEPLPLKMPVNRYNLRRVLAYSGIAAVLLLSAALVVPTLMPSGLLNRPAQFAANHAATPDADAGFARADEDEVYDGAALGTSARTKVDERQAVRKTTVAAAGVTSEEKIDQPKEALADVGALPNVKSTTEQPAASSVLALAEHGDALDVVTPEADLAGETDITEQDPLADRALVESALAKVDSINDVAETDAVEPTTAVLAAAVEAQPELAKTPAAKFDPFMGYDNDHTPALTPQTQLLVNASSPTLARRDIREWANNNSVRFVEEPAAESIRHRAMAAGGAGDPATASQLYVEIDEKQLPDLLVYLNRAPSQRAELVTLTDADTPMREVGRAGERFASRNEALRGRNTERSDTSDQPKALANRPSEVRPNWPSAGLASGLVPVGTKRDTRTTESETQPAETPDDTTPPAERTGNTTDDASDSDRGSKPGSARPFDWSQLLDNLTIQPARSPAPLLQPEPRDRVRLKVVIQQVADKLPARELEGD